MNESRVMQITRFSGHQIREVKDMLELYKRFEKTVSNMKRLIFSSSNAQHVSQLRPPHILKQIGGISGLQSLMTQMGSARDLTGMFGDCD